MLKRLFSVLVCFSLCATLLPSPAKATENSVSTPPAIPAEGDVWDGSITQPTKLVQKDGVYYYEITKCSELAYVAQVGGTWLGYNYILGNDLILNNVELLWDKEGNLINENYTELNKWNPIGNESAGYTGRFLGNGYSISGLYISDAVDDIGLFGYLDGSTHISDLTLVNAYLCGKYYVGGLFGNCNAFGGTKTIENCVIDGLVKYDGSGSYDSGCGGIAGLSHANVQHCVNFATVISTLNGAECGGVIGVERGCTSLCTNYGSIIGKDECGGIVGDGEPYECANYGFVSGTEYVGGISGFSSSGRIYRCYNGGAISGENYVGGIAGASSYITDCYNAGVVTGIAYCGGIVGSNYSTTALQMSNCYNMNSVFSLDPSEIFVGALVGSDGAVWGIDHINTSYYLQTEIVNSSLFGCGNVPNTTGAEPMGFSAKTINNLKVQATFENWNFEDIWSISTDKNGGYPYLQWQGSTLSDIPVASVRITETSLSLAEGDYAYLTATVSPANANNLSISWKSSDSDVATVSAAGKVTAISAGTAVITVTTEDGGYTATCTVTVTERLAEEYRINSIAIRDNDGALLSEIPSADCLATVSITNLASEGNTLVFLAAYTSTGQYQGVMWVSVEDLPVGSTIKVTLPIDNSSGKIANLKAFAVASFSNMTPLGDAVSFLT